MHSIKWLSVAICLGLACAAATSHAADAVDAAGGAIAARQPAALVDIATFQRATIEDLKASVDAGFDGWWLEAGDQLLLAGSLELARQLLPAAAIRDLGELAPGDLVLHAQGCAESGIAPSLVLVDGLTYRLMRQTPHTREASHLHFAHLGAPEWVDVEPNSVLARRETTQEALQATGTDPSIAALVRQVSPSRWFGDVSALAEFSRSSFNTAQLAAARAHIAGQFAALGLAVSEPQFQFTSGTTVIASNVIGRWQGAVTPDDWIVVGGHYDSRQEQASNPANAPGADDNASGCAGVIEAARVLVKGRPASTILFMCYAGEEQGLHGSQAHVTQLNNAGELARVRRMANMDMIGWSATDDLGVLLGTTAVASNDAVLQEMVAAAQNYVPGLDVFTTRNTCCSDHMPYLNAGRPAVFSIHRGSASAYPHYHRTTDTPANLGAFAQPMADAIVRMNVAAIAEWSGAYDFLFGDSFAD